MLRTIKGHLHHIMVHFVVANYVMALVFAVLYLATCDPGFDTASFYTLAAALVATPLGYITGFRVWRRKYKGSWTRIFKSKLIYGLLLAFLGIVVLNIRYLNPDALMAGDASTAFYVILMILATGCVSILSYFGGRLTIR